MKIYGGLDVDGWGIYFRIFGIFVVIVGFCEEDDIIGFYFKKVILIISYRRGFSVVRVVVRRLDGRRL